MSDFETIDPMFETGEMHNAPLDSLAARSCCLKWEDPAWFGAARNLVLSDVPDDRPARWREMAGVWVDRQPSGNTRDRLGQRIATRACREAGRRPHSPNDATFRSEGRVGFTDRYKETGNVHDGPTSAHELAYQIYRLDLDSDASAVRANMIDGSDELPRAPDDLHRNIAETRALLHGYAKPNTRVSRASAHDLRADDARFHTVSPNVSDRFPVDDDGERRARAADDGLVIASERRLWGKAFGSETVANTTFGEQAFNQVFSGTSTSRYRVFMNGRSVDVFARVTA